VKLIKNKKNNQYSITLPKKKIKSLKSKNPPKEIVLKEVDFKW
jgi:hypothetical protein